MVAFVIYAILFGGVTFVVGSVVSGRALDFIDPSNHYLRSKVHRSALFGALVGCLVADLFSSAYVLAVAAGVMGGIASYAGSGSGEVLGTFALIKGVQHLIVMTTAAFAVSAAACWASLAHFKAREAAGLPTMPVAPALGSSATHFCAQCGTAIATGTRFCPQCGTPETASP